jgi:hypothetical protein
VVLVVEVEVCVELPCPTEDAARSINRSLSMNPQLYLIARNKGLNPVRAVAFSLVIARNLPFVVADLDAPDNVTYMNTVISAISAWSDCEADDAIDNLTQLL